MLQDAEARLRRLELENSRLRRAVEELSILNEVASAVSSTYNLNEVVDLIVEKCVKHLRVEQGAVLLFETQEENAALRTMVRRAHTDHHGLPFRLGDQLTGYMLRRQEPLLINDLRADGRFRLPAEAESVRSLLCVPLRLQGQLIGVIAVFNKRAGEPFTESDRRLLTIIAAQSAQVIENARLYLEQQALVRMEQDMRTAQEIQRKLLPTRDPELAGYEIAGRSESARDVGGDYFDFLETGDGRLCVCVADVAGKGIAAALLMANVQATMRSQSLTEAGLSRRLERANRLLHASTDYNKFVTMFYAVLDPSAHELQYSNAGHNPPWLIDDRPEARNLDIGGPVLGVFPEAAFEEQTVRLAPGDLLLIYTDGFADALNDCAEEFGEERLRELAVNLRTRPAAEIVERCFEEVRHFCGDAPPTDDMTMVTVRRL